MTVRLLRYGVGNEHNPGDPWGRSELVVHPDGTARLDHHFSRGGGEGSGTGRVDPAALEVVWSGLDRAGFPAAPMEPFVAGATVRHLTVEIDGVPRHALVDWHKAASLPGYAEAFDVLDAVIRQLSGDTVPYPTSRPVLVHDVRALDG
jgi:hypothetical protein